MARWLAKRVRQTLPLAEIGLAGPGLAVFHCSSGAASDCVYRFGNARGVVLGKLFHSPTDTTGLPVSIGCDSASMVARSRGRHLAEHYWGRYVAFFRDEHSDTCRLMRDPTGGVPCFTTIHRGVRLILSSMEDAFALGIPPPSIDWRHVAARLVHPFVQTRQTDLVGVSEVQPGECLVLNGERESAERVWHPARIALEDPIEDVMDAIGQVRRTVQQCVDEWASCYPGILHLLSGGLDSAVVLACLQRSPSKPRVVCLNHFDASLEGDERRYARLAASRHDCTLIEAEYDVSGTELESLLGMDRTPRICGLVNHLITRRAELVAAREHDADALFGGGGGDQLFHQGATRVAAADYVHRHALGRRFPGTVLAMAYAEDLTFWEVLRSSLWRGLIRRRADPLSGVGEHREFLSPGLLEAVICDGGLVNPVLEGEPALCQGKMEHVLALSQPVAGSPLWTGSWAPDAVNPLLSQPLIELCLRIPTYVLCAAGHDRAVERRAFERDVPSEIVWRRDKGGTTDSLTRLLERNAAFVRELLLDGILVKKGFLVRQKLERFFAHPYSYLTPGAMEIVDDYLGAEVWLRQWESVPARARATGPDAGRSHFPGV